MITWMRKLRDIVKLHKQLLEIIGTYNSDKEWMSNRIACAEQTIKDRTDIHTDFHFRGQNQIIAIGRHRNRDYVQVFTIDQKDFDNMLNILRDITKFTRPGRFDIPSSFKAVIERELDY